MIYPKILRKLLWLFCSRLSVESKGCVCVSKIGYWVWERNVFLFISVSQDEVVLPRLVGNGKLERVLAQENTAPPQSLFRKRKVGPVIAIRHDNVAGSRSP